MVLSAGTAATYVLCRGQRVVGYYALAMSSIAHEQAPSRLRPGMPDAVPVVLLARLAIDRSEQGHQLGGHLLVDALRRCARGGREFDARAMVVDAINDEVHAFYQHFDFTHSNVADCGGGSATSHGPSGQNTEPPGGEVPGN